MRDIRPEWCKKYDGAGGAYEGLAWVKLNGKYGFVNLKGEEVVPPKYDDVENFPNKFTADYLFLINQTESDIPRVNQPSRDLKKALDAKWAALKARADEITGKDLPAINKQLWDAGIGAIWKD